MTELELAGLDRIIKDTAPTLEQIAEAVADYKEFRSRKETKGIMMQTRSKKQIEKDIAIKSLALAKSAFYEAYNLKPTIEEANAEGFDTL